MSAVFHPTGIYLFGLGGGFLLPILYQLGPRWLHAGFWIALSGMTACAVLPAFEAATSGLATVALDPSRGQILSLLVNTRSLADQIPFGGAIGYTTIALGVFAALIAIWRWTVLFATSRRVAATQRSAQGTLPRPEVGGLCPSSRVGPIRSRARQPSARAAKSTEKP